MPLSSPSKRGSRAEVDARQQAQIQDLTSQRNDLVRKYRLVLGSNDHAVEAPAGVAQSQQASSVETVSHTEPPTPSASTILGDQIKTESIEVSSLAPPQADIDETVNHANHTLKMHIKLLHDYNEIKDIASALVGLIADQRGVKIAEVLEEMGFTEGD